MEKPILFNTEMVKAILEGRKTCTRRIIKGVTGLDCIGTSSEDGSIFDHVAFGHGNFDDIVNAKIEKRIKVPYLPGDILYIRETWAVCDGLELCSPNKSNIEHQKKEGLVWYRADGEQSNNGKTSGEHLIGRGRWRPSIHMPKRLARIFLEVTNVRIERLNTIEYEDVLREGIKCDCDCWTKQFHDLWDSTIKKDKLDKYGFNANPYVYVIDFKKIDRRKVQHEVLLPK